MIFTLQYDMKEEYEEKEDIHTLTQPGERRRRRRTTVTKKRVKRTRNSDYMQ